MFGRQYSKSKLFAAVVISIGLIIVTMQARVSIMAESELSAEGSSFLMGMGIAFMVASLFTSAMLGFQQEELKHQFDQYDSTECLFFTVSAHMSLLEHRRTLSNDILSLSLILL